VLTAFITKPWAHWQPITHCKVQAWGPCCEHVGGQAEPHSVYTWFRCVKPLRQRHGVRNPLIDIPGTPVLAAESQMKWAGHRGQGSLERGKR
jgi:hypothetical protein